jgi:DNA-binding response OmpR family regulator
MATILIVSNQIEARNAIAEDVGALGFDTVTAADMGMALDTIDETSPSLVLLDLFDRTHGAESAWRALLRQSPRDLPVVLLMPEEALSGFEFPSQAVDFILVPFGKVELGARLQRIVGVGPSDADANVVRRGGLEIDLDRYQVAVDGEPVDLTLKEFELLRFLAQNPGKVHTRESLMARVWGYDYFGGTRTVDVHIRRVRAKLEPLSDEYIHTVRGVGYRFRE